MIRWLVGCACAMVVGTAGSTLAHHSAAGIDRTKSLTVSGTVKEFRWANPHSWIDVDVPDDKGSSVTWSVEMTSPAFLVRAGWKATTIKPATRWPSRCGRSGTAIRVACSCP